MTLHTQVDQRGHVLAAGPGGISVLSPSGALLGLIDPGIPDVCTSCALSLARLKRIHKASPAQEPVTDMAWNADFSALYVSTCTHLLRLVTNPTSLLT